MKNNFFRKDLNLNNRWWHRLFFVVFIASFVIFAGARISQMVDDNKLPKYVNVGLLSDRLDNKVRLIGELVSPNEKIAVNEHNLYGSYNGKTFYSLNGGWLLKQQYYCSNNIAEKVEEVSSKTGINYYKGNLDLTQLSDFKKYLLQNNAICIQILDLDNYERYGNVKKAFSWGLEADDMSVWKVSIVKTIFSILLQIFSISILFSIIMVIYYKIIIYIIFGSKNKF